MIFVEQSGFGDFLEERRVLQNGIVESYVGRGRGGGVGGDGGCVGWGNGGGHGWLDGACCGGLWVALGAEIRCRIYVDGAGVAGIEGVAGVETCGKPEGDLDEGC